MSWATPRRTLAAFWVGALVVLALLLGWTRALWSAYLVMGGVLFLALLALYHWRVAALLGAAPRRWVQSGLAVLAIGLLSSGIAHWRFELIEFRWERLSAQREDKLVARLADRMEGLRTSALRAAELGAQAVADTMWRHGFRELSRVRAATGVDALVLLNEVGDPVAWAGEHRGLLPETLRDGPGRAYFEERPLFSYLYFVQLVPDRNARVVSAVLIETGLGGSDGEFLAGLFDSPLDARISFHTPQGAAPGRGVWALTQGVDTVVKAHVRPLTQRERRLEVEPTPRRVGVLLAGLAFALLAIAFLTSRGTARGPSQATLLALLPLLAIAPFGDTFGVREVFSPGFFLIGSGDLTLGRILVLLIPVAALVAALRRPALPRKRLVLVLLSGALAVALAYPGGLHIMIAAATRPLLESGTALWIGLQLASVLLLTVVTGLALPRVPPDPEAALSERTRRALTAIGALLALLLSAVVAARDGRPMTTWPAVLWAIPFVLVGAGAAFEGGRRGAVRRWLLAGWLAVTAVLPHLWTAHVQARLATAQNELSTLGSQEDPYLEYLLRTFSEEALSRYTSGERGVQLLYRTWMASGLARESYASQIALWSPTNLDYAKLGTGEVLTPDEAGLLTSLVDDARIQGRWDVSPFKDQPHMSRLLTVPLPDDDVITVLIPPRRTIGRAPGLSSFFGSDQVSSFRLNLVPAQDPAAAAATARWERARLGWRTETAVQYPDGLYIAHLLVPLPPRGVWLARAALLMTLDMAVLLALWALGLLARGASPFPRGSMVSWVGSFRARVTLALLAFFLIPTVVFGYVAYRALSQEVERATQIVAARAAAQGVTEFASMAETGMNDLRLLAQHAGADVLLYRSGELQNVSAPEALELGIYNAWMPPRAFGLLQSGQERAVQDVQEFGDERYVTAYHAMVPTGVLAVPMPVVSGDVAIRQRELAHLIAFAAVLGSLLSLALSVAVGRALAGPIGLLRRAAAAVGAGRLRVQLPENEPGEFGQVFTSFNRMVRRLRRAQARELRSARVLAWGEMARQVAHEIKNPLTPIKLSVQHLRRAHRDRHPAFEQILEGSVHEILGEIDRLSEIARAFSRYGAPDFAAGPIEAVDVSSVIHEALTLYRAGDEGVQYHEVLDPGVPRVQARTGELKEVLLNLIENARAALDGSGEIVVRALAHDERIELEVEDNGSGISPDLLSRIFDPHFSTRSTGTGLGLAIVRRLVESWGGTVSVDSRASEGTTVRLRLLPAPAPSTAEPQGTR